LAVVVGEAWVKLRLHPQAKAGLREEALIV